MISLNPAIESPNPIIYSELHVLRHLLNPPLLGGKRRALESLPFLMNQELTNFV